VFSNNEKERNGCSFENARALAPKKTHARAYATRVAAKVDDHVPVPGVRDGQAYG
jgi:hypothetical protein